MGGRSRQMRARRLSKIAWFSLNCCYCSCFWRTQTSTMCVAGQAADGLEALLKIARSKDIRLETGELLPSDAATALAAKLRSIHELKETGNR